MSSTPVILVTAGSAGLGLATATLFAENGWRVAINYANNNQRAAESLKTLKQRGNSGNDQDFAAIQADLAQRSDIDRLMNEPRDINTLEDNLWEEDWDACFNVNVKSHLWLMAAAKEHLEKTKGAFVTTSSLAGVTVSGSSMAYSVTKAAQIHLAKCLANACGPNIRVNTVSPGLMLTDWGLSAFSEEKQAAHQEKTKLKQLITVDDVAQQVLCFVKSRGVTGANAIIDAGASI